MSKLFEKAQVIKLRKEGKSYSEIKKIINVSKSSLSLWLKNVSLTKEQIEGLKEKKHQAVERYINAMKKKREEKLQGYYNDQKLKWLPLSEREEYIAGLFLYWGEGNKVSNNSISISNTDPSVIKFSINWLYRSLKIPKDKIFIKLHLYKDMDIDLESQFWSEELGVDMEQFKKPYIKDSLKSEITQRGFGHGTCGVWAYKTEIKENILMGIKAISDSYNEI